MFSITTHDIAPAADARCIDQGLSDANAAAAPLHEVMPVSCIARGARQELLGGLLGRSWGRCAEVQQLWVDPAHRRQGIARGLMQAFELAVRERGVSVCYLETFSFQARGFYERLGYSVQFTHTAYPHGIERYLMSRALDG
jgi:ribosomal protein S18 acetylase RimI-like enzyme